MATPAICHSEVDEMYCNFCFWGRASQKQSFIKSVISQFSKAYYSRGIHVNVFKLCILTNLEVVFLAIWFIS